MSNTGLNLLLTARLERCNFLSGPVQDADLQAKNAILNRYSIVGTRYSIVVTIIEARPHAPRNVSCPALSRCESHQCAKCSDALQLVGPVLKAACGRDVTKHLSFVKLGFNINSRDVTKHLSFQDKTVVTSRNISVFKIKISRPKNGHPSRARSLVPRAAS